MLKKQAEKIKEVVKLMEIQKPQSFYFPSIENDSIYNVKYGIMLMNNDWDVVKPIADLYMNKEYIINGVVSFRVEGFNNVPIKRVGNKTYLDFGNDENYTDYMYNFKKAVKFIITFYKKIKYEDLYGF